MATYYVNTLLFFTNIAFYVKITLQMQRGLTGCISAYLLLLKSFIFLMELTISTTNDCNSSHLQELTIGI